MEETVQQNETGLILCTNSNVVSYNIQWTIKNFSFYGQLKNEYQCIHSPLLPTEGKKNFWRIKLFPFGNGEKNKGYISIFLYPNESCERDFITKATISLVNCSKIKKDLIVTRYDPDWGFSQFAKREDILNDPGFLSTDSLIIRCEIKVVESVSELAFERLTNKKINNLSEDMVDLLNNKAFCDASILVGKHEFKVHKSILAARSSVFAAMFFHNFEESKTNVVKVEDISPEVMEGIIHYIYTDKFPKLKELVEEALAAADKYALLGLKDICADELNSQLACDTAAQLLLLADKHNITPLKKNVTNFVVANSKAVIGTPSWKEMVADEDPLVTEVAIAAFSK